MTAPEPIRWDGHHLELLDQRLLPHDQVYLPQPNADAVAEAIRTLTVRGAPAIGIAAAYGLVVAMQPHSPCIHQHVFRDRDCKRLGEIIAAARPTAVNLRWAVESPRSLRPWHQPNDPL